MEFDKSRIYTSVNAEELKPGDKVIVADDLQSLKEYVLSLDKHITTLDTICGEYAMQRFCADADIYALAYLVERKENCTNCGGHCEVTAHPELDRCEYYKPITKQRAYEYDVPIKGHINEDGVIVERQVGECHVKFKPYTEEAKKAYDRAMTNACPEKHYRPFMDTDELIEKWWKLNGWSNAEAKYKDDKLRKPLIWVKDKESGDIELISMFGRGEVFTREYTDLNDLFDEYTFLDGSPCGVEA